MTLKALALAALAVVLVIPADGREPEITPIGDVEIQWQSDAQREAGDRCSAGRSDYYWAISNWFTGNEVYATLGLPEVCAECGGGWHAVSVTMYLYWATADECQMSAVSTIREAEPCGESYVPGDIIVMSEETPVGDIETAGLWAVTIELPEDTPILTEPFCVTVAFLDACDNLPKLVTNSGPCTDGQSWNNWGTGWQSLCDFSFPGDVSLYATLRCQGPTAVEQSTWTTIKAIYRNQ